MADRYGPEGKHFVLGVVLPVGEKCPWAFTEQFPEGTQFFGDFWPRDELVGTDTRGETLALIGRCLASAVGRAVPASTFAEEVDG